MHTLNFQATLIQDQREVRNYSVKNRAREWVKEEENQPKPIYSECLAELKRAQFV